MANGYISHVRGSDPLVFAKKVEKGVIPNGLLFTRVTQCKMSDFQQSLYDRTKVEAEEDALDRKAAAVANFVFPCLSNDKKTLDVVSGNEGIMLLKSQLKSFPELLNKKIAELIKNEKETDLISLTADGQTITGRILRKEYLKMFSTKFIKHLKK